MKENTMNAISKARINRGGARIGILTAFATLILFGLTFSSCKDCNSDKNRGKDKDPSGNGSSTDNPGSGSSVDDSPAGSGGGGAGSGSGGSGSGGGGGGGGGAGSGSGGSNTQDLVPTKTSKELKADIIKLLDATGMFPNRWDALFRDIILEAAYDIHKSIDDNNSNAKKWANKFGNMWAARVQWVCEVDREIVRGEPPYDDSRVSAEGYKTEAERLRLDAESDIEKIKRKDYDGLLEQRIVSAETSAQFTTRQEMLDTALKTVEGEKGNEANGIWKELTATVDMYRIQKAKEEGK